MGLEDIGINLNESDKKIVGGFNEEAE